VIIIGIHFGKLLGHWGYSGLENSRASRCPGQSKTVP